MGHDSCAEQIFFTNKNIKIGETVESVEHTEIDEKRLVASFPEGNGNDT